MKAGIVTRLVTLFIGTLTFNTYAADFIVQTGENNANNRSPQLYWQGEPAETRSFAVTIYDTDVPAARGKNHWTLFNIDSDTHFLEKGGGTHDKKRLPENSIQSRNDFGSSEYTGICQPADATHHVVITVWALNVPALPLDSHVSPAMARLFIRQHMIGRARLSIICGM